MQNTNSGEIDEFYSSMDNNRMLWYRGPGDYGYTNCKHNNLMDAASADYICITKLTG